MPNSRDAPASHALLRLILLTVAPPTAFVPASSSVAEVSTAGRIVKAAQVLTVWLPGDTAAIARVRRSRQVRAASSGRRVPRGRRRVPSIGAAPMTARWGCCWVRPCIRLRVSRRSREASNRSRVARRRRIGSRGIGSCRVGGCRVRRRVRIPAVAVLGRVAAARLRWHCNVTAPIDATALLPSKEQACGAAATVHDSMRSYLQVGGGGRNSPSPQI